jgi:hypothetical protein
MNIQRKDCGDGKYRIWVTNDGLNCEILEYSHDPSGEEIFIDFQKIQNRQAEEKLKDNGITNGI